MAPARCCNRQRLWLRNVSEKCHLSRPYLHQQPPKGIAGGLLLATLGAIAFSGKAIIVKLGYRYGADAVLLLMLRMLFALPLFLVMAWWAGRGRPPLSRRDWWGVVGLGFCGYLSSYLDFAGLRYITASLERLILYLNLHWWWCSAGWSTSAPSPGPTGRHGLELLRRAAGLWP